MQRRNPENSGHDLLYVVVQDKTHYGLQKAFSYFLINPCHAEEIKMPCPLLIFSQSHYLIQVFDTSSHIK